MSIEAKPGIYLTNIWIILLHNESDSVASFKFTGAIAATMAKCETLSG
jgi:hypothetical protein